VFTSTTTCAALDYLKVPYEVVASDSAGPEAPLGRLWATDRPEGPQLIWTVSSVRGSRSFRGAFEVAGCRLAGTVTTGRPEDLLRDRGTGWRSLHDVVDLDGRRLGAVLINEGGDVWLPFDPGAVMHGLWSESYRRLGAAARVRSQVRGAGVRVYYALRPLVPRELQLSLRRRMAQRPVAAFPRWPLEPGLHDMYDWLLGLCSMLAGRPVPWIAPWPDDAEWCFVLTHDVETAQGCADLDLLRQPERDGGYHSAWNFVPERYETPGPTVAGLWEEGCEVGVHGLRHDGRDLASVRTLRSRLPAIRAAARQWGASGFRSPATQRGWSLMPMLGFDHDSSYTDTDPYEPQPGGCCSYLPFFIDDLVELPITLPQDHTLFSILGHTDGHLWVEKADQLRRRGGMVLVLAHPDYAHGAALQAWRELLEAFRDDTTMWQPLPREVATWWRERAASRIVDEGGSWSVVGPGAGRARVRESAPTDVRSAT
jgi:hypothetical protein